MRRRTILGVLGGTATWPTLAHARPARAQSRLRVGWLSISKHPFVADFLHRMKELGYAEGGRLEVEYRYAEGNAERLPALVAELLTFRVDIIAVSGSAATDAVVALNKTVPAVFVTSDPIGAGNVASLSRPGGNITGIETMSLDLVDKKVELIHAAMPGLDRLAVMTDGSKGGDRQMGAAVAAAKLVGIDARTWSAPTPDSFADVVEKVARAGSKAVIAVSSPLFSGHVRTLAALMATYRLPAMFDNPNFVQAGALMSYGVDLAAAFRRQAELVVRIATGTKPADLPVERGTKLLLAVNKKTADKLGLTVSPTLLARADEVIE